LKVSILEFICSNLYAKVVVLLEKQNVASKLTLSFHLHIKRIFEIVSKRKRFKDKKLSKLVIVYVVIYFYLFFCAEIYPASVTKQKREKYRTKTKARHTSTQRSFSSSSDSESLPDLNKLKHSPGNSPDSFSLNSLPPKNSSRTIDRDTDSRVVDSLFKTPNPIRKKKGGNQSKTENTSSSQTPKSVPVSGYISLSDSDEGSDNDCGLDDCLSPVPSHSWSSTSESSIDSSGNRTPRTPDIRIKPRTPLSVKVTQPRLLGTPGFLKYGTPQVKRLHTYSFLRSLSNKADNDLRDPEAKR